jgi:hypothetical protein
MGQDSGTSPTYAVPRLLAFYQDLWDDDGTAVGWRPVAWGLRFHDGSALSISIEGRPSVTLWHSVEDATEALDAYVDTAEPRISLDRPLPPPPPPPQGAPLRKLRVASSGEATVEGDVPDDADGVYDGSSLGRLSENDTRTT